MIIGILFMLCLGLVLLAGTAWVLMKIAQGIMEVWKEINSSDNHK